MGDTARLYGCLQHFGGLRIESLRERKILQKKIYFLQKLGLNLGFHYGLYLYGPYSSDLAHAAYELAEQEKVAPKTIEHIELSSQETDVIDSLNHFLEDLDGDPAHWLELLSSLHFLATTSVFKTKDKEKVFSKLKENKPKYTREEIEKSWSLLIKHGLISSSN